MVGVGQKGDFDMYEIVYESEFRAYRAECSAILKETCRLLKEKGISAQYTLVGSGARNLVTRNGNGPYDLDYNLEIVKADSEYWDNLCHLKDTVRVTLDEAAKSSRFRESQDSTSVLTALLLSADKPNVEFSFDVAILRRDRNGKYMRLIRNKNAIVSICGGADLYTWNEVPSSHNVREKADKIKKAGKWQDVRDRYADLKNLYLTSWERNKPSFIVYVETVNEIYDKIFRR